LCDAFQVPKLLSLQLLPFGKSDDDLGELTFEVMQFFCSVRVGRTVRGVSADGPRGCCSSGVLRVLARLSFRSVVALSFGWAKFRTVRVYRAAGPRVPGGQSACSPRTVRFSRFATGGSVRFNERSAAHAGQSAARVRTVRGTVPDGPRGPSRTVRPAWPDGPPEAGSLASWFDSSLPFSCFRVCFKESFLRLEVDP
jgi:hypothetical protein